MNADLLDVAISDLQLSGYAKGYLKRAEIGTLREIAEAKWPIFYRPGIGEEVMNEVMPFIDPRYRERDEILLLCSAIEKLEKQTWRTI